jgi:GntR family histidine utilization transcriptional repressor
LEISDHVSKIEKSYKFVLEKCFKGSNGSEGIHWPGVIEETPIIVIECVHFSDNIPIQHERRFINLHSAPEADSVDFSSVSPGKWIKNYIPFPTVTQELGAVGAGNSLSDLLRVRRATPCIGIRQLIKKNDEFISFAELTSPAGRFQIYSLYEP